MLPHIQSIPKSDMHCIVYMCKNDIHRMLPHIQSIPKSNIYHRLKMIYSNIQCRIYSQYKKMIYSPFGSVKYDLA